MICWKILLIVHLAEPLVVYFILALMLWTILPALAIISWNALAISQSFYYNFFFYKRIINPFLIFISSVSPCHQVFLVYINLILKTSNYKYPLLSKSVFVSKFGTWELGHRGHLCLSYALFGCQSGRIKELCTRITHSSLWPNVSSWTSGMWWSLQFSLSCLSILEGNSFPVASFLLCLSPLLHRVPAPSFWERRGSRERPCRGGSEGHSRHRDHGGRPVSFKGGSCPGWLSPEGLSASFALLCE